MSGTFVILPSYADSVTDSMSTSFPPTNILSRTAPIYSYAYSGPRRVQVSFELHRDLLHDLNYKDNTSINKEQYFGWAIKNGYMSGIKTVGDNYESIFDVPYIDYVEYCIRAIQAAALPSYEDAKKMVNPPIVALRLGADIFIKGVVDGVNLTYHYPIMKDYANPDGDVNTPGRYAHVGISFNVSEIDPYDATTVIKYGSYRGMDKTLFSDWTKLTGQWEETAELRSSFILSEEDAQPLEVGEVPEVIKYGIQNPVQENVINEASRVPNMLYISKKVPCFEMVKATYSPYPFSSSWYYEDKNGDSYALKFVGYKEASSSNPIEIPNYSKYSTERGFVSGIDATRAGSPVVGKCNMISFTDKDSGKTIYVPQGYCSSCIKAEPDPMSFHAAQNFGGGSL